MPPLPQSRPFRVPSPTRGLLRACALAVTTLALVAAPSLASGLTFGGSGHDRTGSTQTVELSGIDARGARLPGAVSAAKPAGPAARTTAAVDGEPVASGTTAVTEPVTVEGDVAVVGASWPASSSLADGAQLQVRSRTGSTWGQWQALDADDSHGPDTTGPGAAEGKRARSGTEPFVVTGADAVQVRVEGAAPAAQTKVEVIDPGEQAADPTVGQRPPDAASAAAAQPTIYSRKSWGADESLRKGTVEYGSVQAAFVHHTAGTNDYTAAQVPAIIRGIYAFHVNGRGWNDIGYNFLVDKFGRVWEGRYGGIALPVVGAHTQGYNSQAFAMSAMGNFDTANPPAAMLSAYSRLFAWKMGLHGIPATGTVMLSGTRFNRISGHRDAGQTSCPGTKLYAKLATIRTATAKLMGAAAKLSVGRSLDSGNSPDLVARRDSGPSLTLAEATLPVAAARKIGGGWQRLSLVTASPDLTGDGEPDVVARTSAGQLVIYRGDGAGGFSGASTQGGGWRADTRLVAPGDLDGDGTSDLLAVDARGRLLLYPGDGHGWVLPGRVIGGGWQALSLVTAGGDLTGDGVPDLLAVRSSDGALLRYPGVSGGALGAATVIGGGWNIFDRAVGGSDLDADGHPDLVVRERGTGRMRTYYGTAAGTVTQVMVWGGGWQGMVDLTGAVAWDTGRAPDLLTTASNGDLLLYSGTARREYDTAGSGLDLAGYDTALVVGDLDRDGHSDVVARQAATGDLYLFDEPGVGAAPVAPRRIGKGWQVMSILSAAGDVDKDGVPDLLAKDRNTQTLYVYPMTAAGGFLPRRILGTNWGTVSDVVGVGTWDGDGAPDLVARMTNGSLRLYIGNGPGRLITSRELAPSASVTDLVGAGDVEGDGRAELLVTDTSGRLVAYAPRGTGLTNRTMVQDASTVGLPLG
jgi:hypothetical protein